MKITLEYPEFCLLSSITLNLAGSAVFSYVMLGLSLFLGLARLAMKIQNAQQESAQLDTAFEKVKDVLISAATASNTQDFGTRH